MKKIFTTLFFISLFIPCLGNAASITCNPAAGPLQEECLTSSSATSNASVKLPNPLGEGKDDPRVILGNVLKVILGMVGSLALVIFIYGGLTWMTSAGNSERVKSGRDTLVWATLGLLVIFASYTLVAYIFQIFIE